MKDIAVTFDVSINESQLMNVPLIGIDYETWNIHIYLDMYMGL